MEPTALNSQINLFGQPVTTPVLPNPTQPRKAIIRPTWIPADCTLQGVIMLAEVRFSEKFQRWENYVEIHGKGALYATNRSPLTNQMVWRFGDDISKWVGMVVSFEKGLLLP